jgi:hypothetical protein
LIIVAQTWVDYTYNKAALLRPEYDLHNKSVGCTIQGNKSVGAFYTIRFHAIRLYTLDRAALHELIFMNRIGLNRMYVYTNSMRQNI